MMLYNPIGKTLLQVHRDCGCHYGGWSIFVLQDENDTTGKRLDEHISIGLILKEHPEYANYIVKLENDFYGTNVLRIIKNDCEVVCDE